MSLLPPASAPRAIAILGAECTGKSSLASQLTQALLARGQSSTTVDEQLRIWCERNGRIPRADEQRGIACAQQQAMETALASHAWVVCDTTPLVTAVYSELVYDDTSLYPEALAWQKQYALTLLTGCDLPWVADGFLRDGEGARQRFDQRMRDVLVQSGTAFSLVLGQGSARLEAALRIIDRQLLRSPSDATAAHTPWKWMCERCSDAQCEHRLFRGLTNETA
ncbi:ATP-binding protein [Curvibacter sp. APW13]|uniref:ATP-binding protein n=1 Tax=Curvibacter sp. APW13 TaxID=3077236 RepID=UPI0028DD7D82|nr:ATP-binding protein [Curvibacter sp. APW13]MDT8991010.1 ATP-binding protein [Curvibacter sp. APW13]